MLKLLLKLIRCTSGTATIEGIIVLPLAVALMAGGVEFGRLFSAYSIADKSMRNAGRYLARLPTQGAICDWGLTNARNLAVYGMINPGQTDQPLIPAWATSTVNVDECVAGFSNPAVITVSANVPYTVIFLSAVGLTNSYSLPVRHQERYIGE